MHPRWGRVILPTLTLLAHVSAQCRYSSMQHRDAASENSKKVYTRGSVLPFGEDATHEFKGHRNLAVEELPPWCFVPGTQRRSRRAISR